MNEHTVYAKDLVMLLKNKYKDYKLYGSIATNFSKDDYMDIRLVKSNFIGTLMQIQNTEISYMADDKHKALYFG